MFLIFFKSFWTCLVFVLKFVFSIFVMGIDFLTFGLLSAITWIVCKVFKPIMYIFEKIFDFIVSHTTYNLWIFGFLSSIIGFVYMILRFIYWFDDLLHNFFKRIYDCLLSFAHNIIKKGSQSDVSEE